MLDYGNKKNSQNTDPYQTNFNRNELLSAKDFKWKDQKSDNDIVAGKDDFKKQYFYNNSELVIDSTVNSIVNISLAYGGLSNLWGGAVLPVHDDDITEWPISNKDLKKYYKIVSEFMNILGEEDNLSKVFKPSYLKKYNFSLGKQMNCFYQEILNNEKKFNNNGIFFGRAKLAINPDIPLIKEFPYGPIFNSALEIDKVLSHPNFEYQSNIFVENFQESKSKIIINGTNKLNSKKLTYEADKLLIGCGTISSTLLLARSLNLKDSVFEAKTNSNAFFPFLRLKRTKGISKDKENNIAQLFLEIKNKNTNNTFVHLQVYEYGDYVLEPIRRIIRKFTPFFVFFSRFILERIVIMQGMLHSDLSDTLQLKVVKYKKNWKIKIVANLNPVVRKKYLSLIKIINNNFSKGIAFKLGMFIDPPGAGNHIGGTFPMKKYPNPEKNESDTMGRVLGLNNVHIIDASILPSLPAPTITYTIMANAARIADQMVVLNEQE